MPEESETGGVETAAEQAAVHEALIAPDVPQGYEVGADSGMGELSPSYVYAVGRVEPRFPTLGVEKEFAQATGRSESVGLTDRQALQEVLSDKANRYLVRKLCWVLTIEGLETYVLTPSDPLDFDLLVEALRPSPRPTDVDVVIGLRAGITPPDECNGLTVPRVLFTQIYSFDVDSLVQSLSPPEDSDPEEFNSVAEELLSRLLQITDNAGATDEHRALNYLAVRYQAIYDKAAEAFGGNASLTRVEVRPSRLSGVRRIVDVIFSYTHRQTDVTEQFFVRVDVTEMFPFLVTKLMPYYER